MFIWLRISVLRILGLSNISNALACQYFFLLVKPTPVVQSMMYLKYLLEKSQMLLVLRNDECLQ